MSLKETFARKRGSGGDSRRMGSRMVASLATGALLATGAVVGVAAPAHAAGDAEFGIGVLNGGKWLGSTWVPYVGYVFCIQPGVEYGFNQDPVNQSSYSGSYYVEDHHGFTGTIQMNITPREAFEISYIAGTHGQIGLSDDLRSGGAPGHSGATQEQNEWAAASEVAIWNRVVDNSVNGGNASDWFSHVIPDSVKAKVSMIDADVAAQQPTSAGSGQILVNMTNYVEGSVTVNTSPANAISTLTIEGATFPGGATTISGVASGQTIPITGDALIDEGDPSKTYNITVTGQATTPGSGYSESVGIMESTDQMTITPGARVPQTFPLSAGAADPLIVFSPEVTTQAPEFVDQGTAFTDVLTARISPGDVAANPWPQWTDGSYLDINATGTLYGPMLSIPEESEEVPSWAPVAGTADAVLSGPGEYTVETDFDSREAGYYTWVWEIDGANQDVFAQTLLPGEAEYNFTDNFAQVVETSITPSGIVATSLVSEEEVAVGDAVTDTLSVSTQADSGGWIQANGTRVPVNFRGTAYFVPGDTAPEFSETVPEGAEVVETQTITATGPGEYESAPVATPEREGFMTWVWEIREEDQPEEFRGYVKDWADGFGIPAETTKILVPEVTTQAQTNLAIGDNAIDTAVITGRIPEAGVDLHFELYEATQDDSGNWVCGEGNLLWTSSSQEVFEEGTYESEESPVLVDGTYHWVEVITTKNGNEIARGVCGLENETTTVEAPEVTTKAQPAAQLGGEIFDVATVTGPITEAGYDLTFEAYRVPTTTDADGNIVTDFPEGFVPAEPNEDGTPVNNLTWVCEATEPVFVTEEPIRVTEEGDYQSEGFTPEEYGQYLWVETLSYTPEDGETIVIHRGECGIRVENSSIVDVTTQAQEKGIAGDTAIDTAIIDGFIPEGSTVTFDAYKAPIDAPQATDGNVVDVCTDATLITTTEPVEIPGGMHDGTEIDSPAITLPKDANDYKVYWVETVKDDLGNVIAKGECGLPNETTTVEGSGGELAWTGSDSGSIALTAGGLVLAGLLAAAGVYAIRRRQTV